MNNNSKVNPSKGKKVFVVTALAAVLMMALNVQISSNSNMMAYATILGDLKNGNDIGQSLECVIVVVGCEGTGSVGSSGDTTIGSNNGNDDNNTGTNPNGPIPPINDDQCALCLDNQLNDQQLAQLRIALGLGPEATLLEICAAIGLLASVTALVELLGGIGLEAQAIVDLLACLDIQISLAEVLAIIGGLL